MNKRLEKLWDQANTRWTCDYKLSGKPREEWRSVPDLFAELIVRECACVADDMKSLHAATAIKEHFGVEE